MTYAPVIRFRREVYRVYLHPTSNQSAGPADLDEGPFGPYQTRTEACAALERLLAERSHAGMVIEVDGRRYTDIASAVAAIQVKV